MALYRRGTQGEPVRDIQDRLSALGFNTAPDAPGDFGEATESAVQGFQETRSLAVDGMVGRETWRTLVDAGFVLGDRQLYYRMPMLHGDDVAELQRNLNAIGFDAGDVDGIFGPDALRAVLDFQHNRQMAEDGIAGPAILPATLAGHRIFVDPFCRSDDESVAAWLAGVAAAARLRDLGAHPITSRSSDTRPAERLRALHANERAVDIVIAFAVPATDTPGIYSFASPLSHSAAGLALAGGLASVLGLKPLGRVMPILRETRAPAVVIATEPLNDELGALTIDALETWLGSEAAARAVT